jgi:predicted metal-dependent hydrolase
VTHLPGTVGAVQVEVVRSPKRRKTVEAREVGGVLRLLIPARMSKDEERHWIEEMTRRFQRRSDTAEIDLDDRARLLARRYRLPEPASIAWSNRQRSLWGSCTPEHGAVRISAALLGFPQWVLDYVIVHELAHLVELSHSARFRELVRRYPKADRAEGYLLAKGMSEAGPTAEPEPAPDQPTLW